MLHDTIPTQSHPAATTNRNDSSLSFQIDPSRTGALLPSTSSIPLPPPLPSTFTQSASLLRGIPADSIYVDELSANKVQSTYPPLPIWRSPVQSQKHSPQSALNPLSGTANPENSESIVPQELSYHHSQESYRIPISAPTPRRYPSRTFDYIPAPRTPHSVGPTRPFVPQPVPPKFYTIPSAPTPWRQSTHAQNLQHRVPQSSAPLRKIRPPPNPAPQRQLIHVARPQTLAPITQVVKTRRKVDAFVANDPFQVSHGRDKADAPSDELTFDDIPTAGSAPDPRVSQDLMNRSYEILPSKPSKPISAGNSNTAPPPIGLYGPPSPQMPPGAPEPPIQLQTPYNIPISPSWGSSWADGLPSTIHMQPNLPPPMPSPPAFRGSSPLPAWRNTFPIPFDQSPYPSRPEDTEYSPSKPQTGTDENSPKLYHPYPLYTEHSSYQDSEPPKRSILTRIIHFFPWSYPRHSLGSPEPRPPVGPTIHWHEYESTKVALRFVVVTFSTQLYLHFLLRLPSLYFSRVARIFEEADMTLPEIKKMALETASQGLKFEIQMDAETSTIPQAYKRLTLTWQFFIDSVMREWKTFNIISVLLLTAILTILQIDSAAEDPVTRYTALFSLMCALISLLFGCMYIIRFGSMRKPYKAAEWALEAKKSKAVIWWNVWVLLAMPAIWLTWSLILYIACIMSFVWRSGVSANDTPPGISKTGVLVLRIFMSVILGVGIVYGFLISTTFRRYGSVMDKAWKERIDRWIEETIEEEQPTTENKVPFTENHEGPFAQPALDNSQYYPSMPYDYPEGSTMVQPQPSFGGSQGALDTYNTTEHQYDDNVTSNENILGPETTSQTEPHMERSMRDVLREERYERWQRERERKREREREREKEKEREMREAWMREVEESERWERTKEKDTNSITSNDPKYTGVASPPSPTIAQLQLKAMETELYMERSKMRDVVREKEELEEEIKEEKSRMRDVVREKEQLAEMIKEEIKEKGRLEEMIEEGLKMRSVVREKEQIIKEERSKMKDVVGEKGQLEELIKEERSKVENVLREKQQLEEMTSEERLDMRHVIREKEKLEKMIRKEKERIRDMAREKEEMSREARYKRWEREREGEREREKEKEKEMRRVLKREVEKESGQENDSSTTNDSKYPTPPPRVITRVQLRLKPLGSTDRSKTGNDVTETQPEATSWEQKYRQWEQKKEGKRERVMARANEGGREIKKALRREVEEERGRERETREALKREFEEERERERGREREMREALKREVEEERRRGIERERETREALKREGEEERTRGREREREMREALKKEIEGNLSGYHQPLDSSTPAWPNDWGWDSPNNNSDKVQNDWRMSNGPELYWPQENHFSSRGWVSVPPSRPESVVEGDDAKYSNTYSTHHSYSANDDSTDNPFPTQIHSRSESPTAKPILPRFAKPHFPSGFIAQGITNASGKITPIVDRGEIGLIPPAGGGIHPPGTSDTLNNQWHNPIVLPPAVIHKDPVTLEGDKKQDAKVGLLATPTHPPAPAAAAAATPVRRETDNLLGEEEARKEAAEVPLVGSAWRAYHPVESTAPPQARPLHTDGLLRQQVTPWATWHPDPDLVLTPPSSPGPMLVADRSSPGLFGPRTPSLSDSDDRRPTSQTQSGGHRYRRTSDNERLPGPPPAGPQPPTDVVTPQNSEPIQVRPAWRTYHPRAKKKGEKVKVAPVAATSPSQAGPSHVDRTLRQQQVTSWSTWRPNADTPPSNRP